MPGVLVDNQTFPLPFRPRPCLAFSHGVSASSDSPLVVDPPPLDLPCSSSQLVFGDIPVAACCSPQPCSNSFNGRAQSIGRIPSLQFYYSPPLSPPSDLGSPSFVSLDGIEESGVKGFPRSCLSKFAGKGLMMPVTEGFDVAREVGSEVDADGGKTDGIPVPLSALVGGASNNLCGGSSPVLSPDSISALHKFLPSNNDDDGIFWPVDNSWPAMDVYSCDDFRMYEFKVRKCMRGRSHDWTECPFAHPGEKARRRDPRRFHYSGTACPDFRKGSCRRGEACEYAHGVFECWLHPGRYRTQPCKDGRNCRRRVCFFAHTASQLRLLPGFENKNYDSSSKARVAGASSQSSSASSPTTPGRSSLLMAAINGGSYDGSPLRQALAAGSLDAAMAMELLYENNTNNQSSPTIAELLSTLQQLQLKPSTLESPTHMQTSPPWSPKPRPISRGFPDTPTKSPYTCHSDLWDSRQPTYEPSSVEPGADLRAKAYGRIENNNCVESDAPDLTWVNELVK